MWLKFVEMYKGTLLCLLIFLRTKSISVGKTNATCSKQDLINKFQADLPKLSPVETETEVSKFLMDGEMLDLYIKYSRKKAEDPTWEPIYQEEDNSPVAVFFRIFSQYAVWIAGGILLKDIVTGYFNKGGADAAV
jgi:hypothetical protein